MCKANASVLSFVLPAQNAWSWTRIQAFNDTAGFTKHYANPDNTDKLWTTGATPDELSEITLPRMLALPTCVAEFVNSREGGCLPHMVHKLVKDKIDGGGTQVQAQKWQLLLNWCLAASQEQGGMSILNIGAPEPALCQYPEFLDWCNQRIQITLGAAPRTQTRHGQGGGGTKPAPCATNNQQHGKKLPSRGAGPGGNNRGCGTPRKSQQGRRRRRRGKTLLGE